LNRHFSIIFHPIFQKLDVDECWRFAARKNQMKIRAFPHPKSVYTVTKIKSKDFEESHAEDHRASRSAVVQQ